MPSILAVLIIFYPCVFLDTGCTKANLIGQEAILNCNEKKWSSFLCILGLASVLNRTDLTSSNDNCRGQGYDGADAVAGHINGLSANIFHLNEKALYIHCYSHPLNLVVSDSLTVVEVNTMMKNVKDV